MKGWPELLEVLEENPYRKGPGPGGGQYDHAPYRKPIPERRNDYEPKRGVYIGGKWHDYPLPKEVRLYSSTKVTQDPYADRGGKTEGEPQLAEVFSDNTTRPPKKAMSMKDAMTEIGKQGYKPETISNGNMVLHNAGEYPDGSKKKFVRMFKVTP